MDSSLYALVACVNAAKSSESNRMPSSALAVLRHPEVFHVAVAGAPVTDWRNYDTIYTERYMRTPEENKLNYALGSCVKLANRLEGELLLLHGMVDDSTAPQARRIGRGSP